MMDRLALSDGDGDELDALMKRLLRLGCVELKLGRHDLRAIAHDVVDRQMSVLDGLLSERADPS